MENDDDVSAPPASSSSSKRQKITLTPAQRMLRKMHMKTPVLGPDPLRFSMEEYAAWDEAEVQRRIKHVTRNYPGARAVAEEVEKPYRISSFGRRENTKGARGFGGIVEGAGYRYGVTIASDVVLKMHTLVQVYFNDPHLVRWKTEKALCGEKGIVTVDHLDSSFEMKAENHHWRLDWATSEDQIANRIFTDESKAREAAKKSLGSVQAREWHGVTPDEWDDDLVFASAEAAGRYTKQRGENICEWVGDGGSHLCQATKKRWEYQRLDHVDDPGYEDEEWRQGDYDWWPKDLWVSDMGRFRRGKQAPALPTKEGCYRTLYVKGGEYKFHEIMGWVFFGPRKNDEDTVDHIDPTLIDDEGCLSNARSNLAGWADKKTQTETSRHGPKAETIGKPVTARMRDTGVETDYTDAGSAAKALGMSKPFVSRVCKKKKKSRTFEAWFTPQPDLVYAHLKVVEGKVVVNLEVERWSDVDPNDWREGGKYFCVRGKKPVRKDISKKRKRDEEDDEEAV